MNVDQVVVKVQHDLSERLARRQWQLFERMLCDGCNEHDTHAMLYRQRQLDNEWLRNYLAEFRAKLEREYGDADVGDEICVEPIRDAGIGD